MSNRPQPRQRTALGYWVPLAVTVAAVTVGIAAWIWSERKDVDDNDDDDADYPYSPKCARSSLDEEHVDSNGKRGVPTIELYDAAPDTTPPLDTFYTRVKDVVRRTPSPQQLFGGTGRRMVAEVAAAGARLRLGKSLDFRDHERWQEEAELRAAATLVSEAQEDVNASQALLIGRDESVDWRTARIDEDSRRAQESHRSATKDKKKSKRKLVVVVVSSILPIDEDHDEGSSMDILNNVASITGSLLHDFIVLIYAPHLKAYPPALVADVDIPLAESTHSKNKYYDELESLAVQIVPHPAHIIPFTTPSSHVHLLKHLAPNLVYMQEEFAGSDSEHALQAKNWVGKMVLVIKDDDTTLAESKSGFQYTRISDLAGSFQTVK